MEVEKMKKTQIISVASDKIYEKLSLDVIHFNWILQISLIHLH